LIFCYRVQINLANITAHTGQNDEDDEEKPSDHVHVSPGLMMWRNAVTKASSSAQLSLCVTQLNKSISWEKSIMKVVSVTVVRNPEKNSIMKVVSVSQEPWEKVHHESGKC
jgi:hypothetical protein